MPQYNGPLAFLLGVLLQLLRSYAAWIFIFAIVMPAPFAIWGMVEGRVEEAVRMWLPRSSVSLSSWFSFAHLMTFLMFQPYFASRFPYAPAPLTFVVAGAIGGALLGLNWTLMGGDWNSDAMTARLLWAAIVTAGMGLFGALMWHVGGSSALHWGPGRWLGWLFVGRTAFEAFLEQEAARLRREYGEYVDSVRNGRRKREADAV